MLKNNLEKTTTDLKRLSVVPIQQTSYKRITQYMVGFMRYRSISHAA
jgi:hypothetical protein